jgi:hypothetical protein
MTKNLKKKNTKETPTLQKRIGISPLSVRKCKNDLGKQHENYT